MDALVVDTTTREHTEIVDRRRTVTRVVTPSLDQEIGRLLVLLPTFQRKIDVHIGVAHAKVLGKPRALLQLLHTVAHLNVADPASNLLIEKVQRAWVVTNGAFEQFLSLRLRGHCAHPPHVRIRQRCENASRSGLSRRGRCGRRVVPVDRERGDPPRHKTDHPGHHGKKHAHRCRGRRA